MRGDSVPDRTHLSKICAQDAGSAVKKNTQETEVRTSEVTKENDGSWPSFVVSPFRSYTYRFVASVNHGMHARGPKQTCRCVMFGRSGSSNTHRTGTTTGTSPSANAFQVL
jgi:hypothetical protein